MDKYPTRHCEERTELDGELSEANQSSDEITSLPRNDEMQKLTASTANGQTYIFTLPDAAKYGQRRNHPQIPIDFC